VKKSESIDKIRKRYRKEWLLIMVDKMDKSQSVPQLGHVIAHNPRRHEVYDAMMGRPEHLLVTYSEDSLPAGYLAAF